MLFVFAIGTTNAQTPIYQFDFDENMTNSGSNSNFGPWVSTGAGSVSYVNDRFGLANKAINIPNTINFNAIANALPGGNASRTLSFWVKFINDTDNRTYPVVGWGINTTSNAFGFWRNGVQNSYYTWGAGNDYNFPQTNAQIQTVNNGWVHIAMTHNGSTLTTYYNGASAGSYSRTLSTVDLKLYLNRLVNSSGGNGDAIQVDDLKIYNTALAASEIAVLYNPTATGTLPVLSNAYSSSPTPNSVALFFEVNPGGLPTTTEIVVTAFGAGISGIYEGPSASGNTTQLLNYNLTGLLPGVCYTYRIQARNSAGNAVASTNQAFCTLDSNFEKTPVYHFEFNGNRQDKNDPTVAFQNPHSGGFVDNNKAIRLNNEVQALNLPFLPLGSRIRTVAIRVMFESGALAQENNVFSYGSAITNQSFGYNQNTAAQATNYFWSNDISFSNPVNFGTYYNMVFVYDGLDTKIYKDGFQVGYSPSITPNTIGSIFRIGRTSTGLGGFFNGRIDDLRIYNEALNSGDVSNLNSVLNGVLSNNDFQSNLKFNLYPNPTNEYINIVMKSELKSVEIYSILGQKVLSASTSKVDVSKLSKGMYMVRVQDISNGVSTQKLMIK